MSELSCYNCGGLVLRGQRACEGCGAEQTKGALAAFQQSKQARLAMEQFRSLAVMGIIVAFAVGGGLGFWAGQGRPASAASTVSAEERTLTVEEVNDLFKRQINDYTTQQKAPINLVGWVPAAQGEVVYEMAPPTRQNPAVLWEALTDQERSALVGFLSLAYTHALQAGNIPVDLERAGHPVFTLKYYGYPQVLATRTRDGRIYINRSPFSRAASSAAPAVGQNAPAPGSSAPAAAPSAAGQ